MSRREVKLVGVLNRTPDSFSDGGAFVDSDTALQGVYDMFRAGASMVDVGGESTRPGATPITPEEEQRRILPILQILIPSYTEGISVDTYHPETVRRIASEIGPFVVNDVTGMNNPLMREAVAELGLQCILSHHPMDLGQDIQLGHQIKPIRSVQQVVDETGLQAEKLIIDGVPPECIKIDPGFGFAKDPKINNELLRFPTLMDDDRFEYYIGVSRKSSLRRKDFYGMLLADFDSMNETETEAWLDNRSVEVAKTAVENGFSWIRVHNVALHAATLL